MPWDQADAKKFTKAARTPAQQKRWASAANAALKAGHDDATAVRIANAAVKKGGRRKR